MTNRCAACGLDVYDGGELCPICQDDPPPGFNVNGANSPVERSTDKNPTRLQRAALAAISEHNGVVAAARALGCNHGVISLAASGEDFPKARKVLGLPPKTVPVEPCVECGQVHTRHKMCERERTPAPYRTLAIRFYDDDDFDRARRALAEYAGTRAEWILEQITNGE